QNINLGLINTGEILINKKPLAMRFFVGVNLIDLRINQFV
ncbi:MAG: hypothetical protein ACI8P7_001557, partial [Candidatus Azotimanducaceae bacterium]